MISMRLQDVRADDDIMTCNASKPGATVPRYSASPRGW
jgi:hypothetical protein